MVKTACFMGKPCLLIWTIHSFHSLPEHQHQLCLHTFLTKGMKFAFIIHFNEFLAAGDWEGDFQLHPEAADHLQDALKKR